MEIVRLSDKGSGDSLGKILFIGNGEESAVVIGITGEWLSGYMSFSMEDSPVFPKCTSSSTVMQGKGVNFIIRVILIRKNIFMKNNILRN